MTSTLEALISSYFGCKTHMNIDPSGNIALGAAVERIVPNNPNRVGLNIINLGANVAYVLPSNDPTATHGIRLDANGGSLVLAWDRDFQMVGYDWWGVSPAGATEITVLEVVAE